MHLNGGFLGDPDVVCSKKETSTWLLLLIIIIHKWTTLNISEDGYQDWLKAGVNSDVLAVRLRSDPEDPSVNPI